LDEEIKGQAIKDLKEIDQNRLKMLADKILMWEVCNNFS
jgi:hypothetical protein